MKDEVIRHVAQRISTVIRVADLLFRHNEDGFVILLIDTPRDVALSIAARINEIVRAEPMALSPNIDPISIEVDVSCKSAPEDGRTPRELLAAAIRPAKPSGPRTSSVH